MRRPKKDGVMIERWMRTVVVAAALGCVVGCNSQTPPNPVKEAIAQGVSIAEENLSVAFRLPTDRREAARVYRLPGLTPIDWEPSGQGPLVSTVVGFAPDEEVLYGQTAAGQLIAWDLTTGRARTVDTSVVEATVGPGGVPYLIRQDGSIARVTRRSVQSWSNRVEPLPVALWGAARSRLVALAEVENGDRFLMGLADGRPPVIHRLPAGTLAISPWGDVAVVSTDSGLVVFEPADSTPPRFERVRPAPGPVAISAAAHHIYTVDAENRLLAYDRFDLDRLRRIELPDMAEALRVDPLGKLLLVRAADGETIWVVDLTRWEIAATLAGGWSDDLPAVAADGTILLRQGDDVVALAAETFAAVDRIEGGAKDLWQTARWDPKRPTLQLARDTVPETAPRGGAFYVQVSSTRNAAWAEDFAQNLKRAGMDAIVLTPRATDDLYRVVLGPYPTREAAELVSRRLGLPSWITTRDTTSAQ